MARTRTVATGRRVPPQEVPLTAAEEAARDAEDQAWASTLVPRAAADAKRRIDALAEETRLAFITGGAGQMLAYDRKERQARDCDATYDAQTPPPAGKYPALEAEVAITGADVLAVAAVVKGKADQWAGIGDQIEAARLGRKAEIDAAAAADDQAAIAAAVTAARADFDAIQALAG